MGDYTLRDIPKDIHTSWKTTASLMQMSMREYCFRVLRNQISEDLTQRQKKQIKLNGE